MAFNIKSAVKHTNKEVVHTTITLTNIYCFTVAMVCSISKACSALHMQLICKQTTSLHKGK